MCDAVLIYLRILELITDQRYRLASYIYNGAYVKTLHRESLYEDSQHSYIASYYIREYKYS